MSRSLERRAPLVRALRIGPSSVVLALAIMLVGTSVPVLAEEAAGPPPTVRIRPLMLPVLTTEGKVERYTQIEVTLEVSDSLRLPEVQAVIPKLHDAILTALYRATDDGFIVRGAVANAPALRKRLMDASVGVVGKDLIGRVLITPMSRQSAWP